MERALSSVELGSPAGSHFLAPLNGKKPRLRAPAQRSTTIARWSEVGCSVHRTSHDSEPPVADQEAIPACGGHGSRLNSLSPWPTPSGFASHPGMAPLVN